MSKALLDALESKLLAAVDTIESLRSELQELKEERESTEVKLRGLIGRIDQAGGSPPAAADSAADAELERPGEGPGSTSPSFRNPSANY